MKKITTIILSILTSIILSSCNKAAQETTPTTNSAIKVDLLFEKDGCKIYRFNDAGHNVYWSDCRGKVESVYNESSGKSSHEVRIQNETTR